MNSTITLSGLLMIMILLASCQRTTTAGSEQAVTKSTFAETEAETITAPINLNLATEAELKGVGLEDVLVDAIVAKRPFLSMSSFHELTTGHIEDEAARTALYREVFVPINLNTASESELKLIPGVGERIAHEMEEYRPYLHIKQFRKEIGKYVEDTEVSRLVHYVFVPAELNTASEEDLLAIPGVGERMLHELQEYRPYQSMEQFRREIGKYVDDEELARLARFVYLKQ